MNVLLSIYVSSNKLLNEELSCRWYMMPWASYQIRKIAGCACAGNAGNVFPRGRFQRKPLVSDPGMHHGTCVTHVPWCMSGSLTCGDEENVPGIPGACAPAILRIWQEAHCITLMGAVHCPYGHANTCKDTEHTKTPHISPPKETYLVPVVNTSEYDSEISIENWRY